MNTLKQYNEAAERWHKRNVAARKAGCWCGAAATNVETIRVTDGIDRELWTCAAHVGLPE